MAEVLLSSESRVKAATNIGDNLAGKYLHTALYEAQEIKLRGVLGDCLLDKCKRLVGDKTIGNPENVAYKDLVDKCQDFLAYSTVVEILNKVTYKVVNFGVAKTNDENLQVATPSEINNNKFYYQSKADSWCLILQNWLLNNKAAFPELDECACNRISSNLHSSASCGIFLGGARGKYRRRR